MKFSCAQCGAKYSVSDQRVTGKVVQVRCKRCSTRIVIRGERLSPREDDTSALFDLKELWAFAAQSKHESQADDDAGSGLIDIAALAAGLERDAVMEPAAQTPAFAPVLAPGTAEPPRRNPLAVIGGGLAVVAVGLLVALTVALTQRPQPRASAAVPTDRSVTVQRVATEMPIETEASMEPAPARESTSVSPPTEVRAERTRRQQMVRRPRITPEPPSERETSERDTPENLSDLIDHAALDSQPARDDVRRALRGVATRVGECGRGDTGVANAAIVFAGSGRVRRVEVTGVPPRVGRCVAREVRAARVEPFRRRTFRVNFPFRVR